MTAVYGSMDEALVSMTRDTLQSGSEVSPRGLKTKEILGASFVLSNPRARRITLQSRNWSEALAVGEFAWHTAGSDRVDFIAYYAPRWASFSDNGVSVGGSCYGKKIFGREGSQLTQWERIRTVLKADPSSRRAVLTLGDSPAPDQPSTRDVACALSVQFLLRAGKLHCVTTMRSNDIIWGLCYDVYLITMLQERLAVELGVEVGWYMHSAASLHIYEQFYPIAESIAGETGPFLEQSMPRMADLEALPAFLAVEEALRLDRRGSSERARDLPTYWRALSAPLVSLREARSKQIAAR